jgi:hypothetical protein
VTDDRSERVPRNDAEFEPFEARLDNLIVEIFAHPAAALPVATRARPNRSQSRARRPREGCEGALSAKIGALPQGLDAPFPIAPLGPRWSPPTGAGA